MTSRMNTLSTFSPLTFSDRELLAFLLKRAASAHQSVALWRLPETGLVQLIISEKYIEIEREDFLEELDPGFLFAPFDKSRRRLFLKADQLFTFEDGRLKTQGAGMEQNLSASPGDLETGRGQAYRPPVIHHRIPPDGSKESFLNIVNNGVAEIERGTFEKIVPSRTRTIDLGENFDVVAAFQKLCASYPQALISFVSIPGVGNWVGASPEVLVSVRDKSIFKTVALAGTLPYQPGTDLRSVAWTQKEIAEQALVERYVISCFKKVRLREYDEHGPRTVVAGNLMHLKSDFTVDMKATNFPQIGSVMLDLLHPTSAVCGMPLEPALSFLKAHEAYDRRFYAGYLGPVNIYNDINLFVNLRCMELSGDRATLYAGAGVTADSIAEKEWSETEMKFNTLLNVIL
jgi:isochorismate synthase